MQYVQLGSTGLDDAVAAVEIGLSDKELEELRSPYGPHPHRRALSGVVADQCGPCGANSVPQGPAPSLSASSTLAPLIASVR